MGRHLDDLIEYCHLNELPLLSSIVVNKPNVESGKLDPESLKGFIAGVKRLNIPVLDDRAFLQERKSASLNGRTARLSACRALSRCEEQPN
jgi:5-methylcytosine-specific restriction protein B